MMKHENTLRKSLEAPRNSVTAWSLPLLALTTLTLASCAAGANDLLGTPRTAGDSPAGFLLGLWHGLIAIIAFIISLFNKNVSVYEVHNTGATYNLGFIIGVMIAFGGGAKGTRRGRKKN